MNKDIFNAFACMDMREIGNNSESLKVSQCIFNRYCNRYDMLTIKNEPIISILDALCDDEIIEMIDISFLYKRSKDYTSDILFLIYILTDVFNLDSAQHVNGRLKYFAFKNILSLRMYEKVDAKKHLNFKQLFFSKLLFCHPTSEDYASLFCLKPDPPLIHRIYYKKQKINVGSIFNSYIEGLISEPRIVRRLLACSIDIDTIKKAQSFINGLTDSIFSDRVNMDDPLFPGVDSYQGDLEAIFTNKRHIFSIFEDKIKFRKVLKDSLKFYHITTWDNKNKNETSLFYGSHENADIEKQIMTTSTPSSAEKYLSQYFIDSCVMLLFRNPDHLKKTLKMLHEDEVRHLLTILFSHPFFDYNARKKMSKNESLISILPDGFWKEKIKFFQKDQ